MATNPKFAMLIKQAKAASADMRTVSRALGARGLVDLGDDLRLRADALDKAIIAAEAQP